MEQYRHECLIACFRECHNPTIPAMRDKIVLQSPLDTGRWMVNKDILDK